MSDHAHHDEDVVIDADRLGEIQVEVMERIDEVPDGKSVMHITNIQEAPVMIISILEPDRGNRTASIALDIRGALTLRGALARAVRRAYVVKQREKNDG